MMADMTHCCALKPLTAWALLRWQEPMCLSKPLHYGAATQPRRKSARHAYFNGQTAVKIQWILKIDMEYEDQGEISKTVAVVCTFVTDDNMPPFPWDLRSVSYLSTLILCLTACC
ncbi:uncharacterized protein HD556DRAFT_1424809 [Suillus plorans]|uniref:Uncharacterized protein n=1 Tax=Suillus plorans TaxID=116603 RepID=A0A9P7DAJ6_9AGAM|nr:uncharacterized protein HD556DRAFT_1424809 [Suillus plorans]KAG1785072.1 hypothetical protein HD556DRAFT_1424809 [Suillus plorans]